ncbi:chemotaxis protein methyltransferase CheR [Gammaproteobacteria bacterium]
MLTINAPTAVIHQALMAKASAVIAERMGLYFPEDRWPELAENIKKASQELGFKDLDTCVAHFVSHELTLRQIETLANYLTVGETYFFREPESFELLEREILPALVAKRRGLGQTLRLWSAGCCTGEEAYTLAIACLRVIPDIEHWNLSILATDINPRFLEKAMQGIYSEWSFRGAPDWFREGFFARTPERKFAIAPQVKRFIDFEYLNLATEVYPSLHNHTNAVDIIFCRNVIMYFTPERQRAVVAALHRCLAEGGIVLVNPAEANADLFSMFTVENHGDGVILFRKISQPTPFEQSAPIDFFPVTPPTLVMPTVPMPKPARPSNPPPATKPPSQLARDYANQGQLDKALHWCQRAIAAEPTNPSAYFLCATIHHESGRLQEALAVFRQVLYLDQDYILAHHALGHLYRQLAKPRESRRHLAIALELLKTRNQDEVLPESEGMTCGQLIEPIRVMMQT